MPKKKKREKAPAWRRFNCKRYERLWKYPNTKDTARGSANRLRKIGVRARVSPDGNKWNVYFRKPQSMKRK